MIKMKSAFHTLKKQSSEKNFLRELLFLNKTEK